MIFYQKSLKSAHTYTDIHTHILTYTHTHTLTHKVLPTVYYSCHLVISSYRKS